MGNVCKELSEKDIKINNLQGEAFEEKYGFPVPEGVRGRNSDNKLFKENIGWEPNYPLDRGMKHTFEWIKNQTKK